MADPSLLQIIGGGLVGSAVTYTLTWWRERRRMKDSYRAPQREAIGAIVASVHELLVSEAVMRAAAEKLASHPDDITDAEIDALSDEFGRGVYGMDRAFSVGKITVVDWKSREAMGDAYNSFILRVHALGACLGEVVPDNAPTLLPSFLDEFRTEAKKLNVQVANLVEVAQGRVSPTQSSLNWWRRHGVKKRLGARADALKQQLGEPESNLGLPPG
jgi:hypothetical protein